MKSSGKMALYALLIVIVIVIVMPATALADAKYDALKKKVELLEKQLKQIKQALKQQEAKVKKVEKRVVRKTVVVKGVKEEVITQADAKKLEKKVNAASEWKDPNTLIHMSGYADVGYVDGDNKTGSFAVGSFSPIFHFQYKNLVMLESELEIELEDDGEAKVNLEYLTIDWFINDYAALVAGKYLSPIGQFRQNIHPSWINKLPSAPPGFGHDGAAPVSDTGFQIRGGFPIGKIRSNYALFIGNGPELIAEWDGSEFEVDGIDAEGKGTDRDDEKVWGARFAILPISQLEIGVSAATGKATVSSIEDDIGTAPALLNEQARDYDVIGFDLAWKYRSVALRGEYVKSEIGSGTSGATASSGGIWETWYAQASYRIPRTRVEAVVRYTDFDTPHVSKDQKQWAVGLNYLFASNFIAKIAFESNDGQPGAVSDDDRWFIQLAYGF